ncbi:MAG: hypothetical protein N4A53_08260 [Pelagimonas sp.]|jgi:uncharacterized protein YfcZ (UPF0381/DUF406 family)|nr:hypothetical protein [Pelagimonas sp.]
MADAGLRILHKTNCYVVVDAEGKHLSRVFATNDEAEDRLARLQKKAKTKHRKCLCCRKKFKSEGIHNRLCNSCRAGYVPGDWMGA